MLATKGGISYSEALEMPIAEAVAYLYLIDEMYERAKANAEELHGRQK